MSQYSPNLGALVEPSGSFAPANFLDAEDSRPLGAVFDITGHGSQTPYTTSIQNMIAKHMDEIQTKTAKAAAVPGGWKKRLRDFITLKNTELLDFLSVSIQSHPVIGPAEILLRRFGNSQVTPSHASVREFVLDGSGVATYIQTLSKDLDAVQADLSGVQALTACTRHIYEQYQIAGDELLTIQAGLKAKLERLDKLQGKLSLLIEIDPSESFEPLIKATEEYMARAFQQSDIRDVYKGLIEAYRKFVALREILQMLRAPAAKEHEPLCSICLNETVGYVVTPCGHTFCQTCVRRQVSSCYMCRTTIKDRHRVFFS